jgi:hypothetical protein
VPPAAAAAVAEREAWNPRFLGGDNMGFKLKKGTKKRNDNEEKKDKQNREK